MATEPAQNSGTLAPSLVTRGESSYESDSDDPGSASTGDGLAEVGSDGSSRNSKNGIWGTDAPDIYEMDHIRRPICMKGRVFTSWIPSFVQKNVPTRHPRLLKLRRGDIQSRTNRLPVKTNHRCQDESATSSSDKYQSIPQRFCVAVDPSSMCDTNETHPVSLSKWYLFGCRRRKRRRSPDWVGIGVWVCVSNFKGNTG
jgi:hypothetical protein